MAAGVTVAALVSIALVQDEEDRKRKLRLPAEIAANLLNLRRQQRKRGGRHEEDESEVTKRAFINWNRERAKMCVEEDYLGPSPRFRDRDFERVFRISRAKADRIMNILGNADPFFTSRKDAIGQESICPKVKFLMALKMLAYGVSPAAFQDYFQTGLSTAHDCLKSFCRIIAHDDDLKQHYRRRMNRSDA